MKNLLRISFIAGCVIILTIILIVAVAVTVFGPRMTPNTPGDSSSTASVNIIDPGGKVTSDYKFAVVRQDDTAAVRDEGNKEIVISLDHRNWQKPSWSPEGNTIAYLAGDTDGTNIPELFTYDVAAATWKQVTFFKSEGRGIGSYLWRSEDNIIFVQGSQPDMWLHNYRLSDGELTKVFRVNGQLFAFDEASGNYLFDNRLSADHLRFELRDPAGTVIALFDTNTFAPGKKLLQVIPDKALQEFLLLTFADNRYTVYRWLLLEQLFTEVALTQDVTSSATSSSTPDEVQPLNYLPLCNLSSQNYLGYYYENDHKKLYVSDFGLSSKDLADGASIESLRSMTLKPEYSVCRTTSAYLAIDQVGDAGQERRWYRWMDGKLVRVDFNYTEIAVR